MRNCIAYLFLFLPFGLSAQGMWMPNLLEKLNAKDMKALGSKVRPEAIYSPVKPSIKDAVVLFGGGCTGEIISDQGLLLTNHHCGLGQIQEHSTVEKNYVDNGFWANTLAEEIPCPGLTVKFIRRMEDVTTLVLQGVTETMGERDRQSQVDKNIAQVRNSAKKEAGEDTEVRPFYNGNQYYLYVTATYRDVRLVGAPPSSIGKFGSETDNWVWPRHTGDFALFRVYAGAENKPAEYSADNKPLSPRYFLPISLSGVEQGDFTMVYGFPGRTNEYLSAAAVQQTGEVLNPARIAIRDKTLRIMEDAMKTSTDVKISYIAKKLGLANSWKKWQGESLGLRTYKVADKKRVYEEEFTNRIKNSTDWNYRYGNVLPRLNQLHRDLEPYILAQEQYAEVFIRNVELLGLVSQYNNWIADYEKNGISAFAMKMLGARESAEAFYKDYRPAVDKQIFESLTEHYAKNARAEYGADVVKAAVDKQGGYKGLAEYIFANSVLAQPEKMKALLMGDAMTLANALKSDPAVLFWRSASAPIQQNVAPKVQELQTQINLIQRQYMAAQMQVFKEKRFFPDANSTLRLTYGKASGYQPRDAVSYELRTYLDGVIEKYVPGDFEFDVPAKLIDLYKTRDYGRYATKDGRMPVAFIGINHTTGGNSGSPALDARGNLVGLNFDRVWEGTMSDLYYEPAICRNIMVDIRYVLFIIDKYAGAKRLIEEMKLVK
jgi:Peptidase S46